MKEALRLHYLEFDLSAYQLDKLVYVKGLETILEYVFSHLLLYLRELW